MKDDLLLHVDAADPEVFKLALSLAANYRTATANPQHRITPLEIAIKAGAARLEASDPFRIVLAVNGPAVKLLTRDNEDLMERARHATANGMQLHAGRFALDNYHIDESRLWDCVEVVPSVMLDIVTLVHEGFVYVKP